MKNLKPQFFEMILEEPLLREKLAIATDISPELIEEMANEQNSILALSTCALIIIKNYNDSMPEHLRIIYSELFAEQVYDVRFEKEFVELTEV